MDTVILTLPADSAYVGILRTTTAGVAARLHFELGAIEDLRIAVDEACTLLLAEKAPQISCRFSIDPVGIQVELSVRRSSKQQHWQNTFAWQLLNSLTDEVSVSELSDTLAITLRKNLG